MQRTALYKLHIKPADDRATTSRIGLNLPAVCPDRPA
jgi:hypothetical protein